MEQNLLHAMDMRGDFWGGFALKVLLCTKGGGVGFVLHSGPSFQFWTFRFSISSSVVIEVHMLVPPTRFFNCFKYF